MRFREKIKSNYSIFFSLESRDKRTLMLKKFHWPSLYSPKPCEKIFFFVKLFRPMRFREKIKFNYSIFFWLESRDQWTVILKKFHWPSMYSPNPAKKFFFLSKCFDQWDFEKKSNSIIRLFSHWNREMSEQWCWKNSIDLCWILQIRGKNFFLSNFFN